MEHRTLDTPVAYLCEIAHARTYDPGLMQERERAWEIGDGKERDEQFAAGI
ncbi:hypothetical protein L1S32_06520 [Methanogenium sp. S4BF]|uniref:hypothetical protein n=1 Tax=Methanogenium sp. S4BF TaxID=1789226 RepID=UPI0024162154|nr:hypothetical protein [Methanogenium sp. S4BF]WFN33511.1 hypothetical protein L1S32_06520 [Methanogenium sp. S4BF]